MCKPSAINAIFRMSAPPRVFVYPITAQAAPHRKLEDSSILAPYGFLVDNNVHGVMDAIVERLRTRPPVDPQDADIFFAVLPPYGPPLTPWTAADRQAIAAMGRDEENYIPNTMRLSLQFMVSAQSDRTPGACRPGGHQPPTRHASPARPVPQNPEQHVYAVAASIRQP